MNGVAAHPLQKCVAHNSPENEIAKDSTDSGPEAERTDSWRRSLQLELTEADTT